MRAWRCWPCTSARCSAAGNAACHSPLSWHCLYGALYGLLASESNALLLGALLIFGMLATLMLRDAQGRVVRAVAPQQRPPRRRRWTHETCCARSPACSAGCGCSAVLCAWASAPEGSAPALSARGGVPPLPAPPRCAPAARSPGAARAAQRRVVALALTVGATLTAFGHELASRQHRLEVNAAAGPVAQALGARFIVGYDDANDLRELAHRGLIGGIFVTGRNVKGRSAGHAARRKSPACRRCWSRRPACRRCVVATDQEGGGVSRLSRRGAAPAGTRPPAQTPTCPARELLRRARAYGAQQGGALAALGITLNFGPVVDLRPGRAPGRWDLPRPPAVEEGAISSDPDITAQVALAYEQGLESAGVRGTFKRFPGLAGVTEDTHHVGSRTAHARGAHSPRTTGSRFKTCRKHCGCRDHAGRRQSLGNSTRTAPGSSCTNRAAR